MGYITMLSFRLPSDFLLCLLSFDYLPPLIIFSPGTISLIPRTLISSGYRWLPQLYLLPGPFSGSRLAFSTTALLLSRLTCLTVISKSTYPKSTTSKFVFSFLTPSSSLLQPSLSYCHYYSLIVQARHLKVIFDFSWFLPPHSVHQCGLLAYLPEHHRSSIPSPLLIHSASSAGWLPLPFISIPSFHSSLLLTHSPLYSQRDPTKT